MRDGSVAPAAPRSVTTRSRLAEGTQRIRDAMCGHVHKGLEINTARRTSLIFSRLGKSFRATEYRQMMPNDDHLPGLDITIAVSRAVAPSYAGTRQWDIRDPTGSTACSGTTLVSERVPVSAFRVDSRIRRPSGNSM